MNNYKEEISQLEVDYDIIVPQADRYGILDVEDVLEFRNELDSEGVINSDVGYEITDSIIDNDYLNEIVRNELDSGGGWERIHFLIQEAEYGASYHHMNGYGNIEALTSDILENMVQDLLDNIEI